MLFSHAVVFPFSLIIFKGRRSTLSPKLPEINMKSSGFWIMDITGSDLSGEEDPICLSFIFYGNLSHKKLPLQVTGKAIQIKVLLSLLQEKPTNHVANNPLNSEINCFFKLNYQIDF